MMYLKEVILSKFTWEKAMNELFKITQIVDKFVEHFNPKLASPMGKFMQVEMALMMAEWHITMPLDLDRMLATDHYSDLAHDILGIYAKERLFSPRFTKVLDSQSFWAENRISSY